MLFALLVQLVLVSQFVINQEKGPSYYIQYVYIPAVDASQASLQNYSRLSIFIYTSHQMWIISLTAYIKV